MRRGPKRKGMYQKGVRNSNSQKDLSEHAVEEKHSQEDTTVTVDEQTRVDEEEILEEEEDLRCAIDAAARTASAGISNVHTVSYTSLTTGPCVTPNSIQQIPVHGAGTDSSE